MLSYLLSCLDVFKLADELIYFLLAVMIFLAFQAMFFGLIKRSLAYD
jgi:hypothetical protein